MGSTIIDGKKIADGILENLKKKVRDLKQKPGLAIVLVGNNPASDIYVSSKLKKAESAGFYVEKHALSEKITQNELLNLVDELNQNKKIHGFIVQLPMPKQINENMVGRDFLSTYKKIYQDTSKEIMRHMGAKDGSKQK